MIKKPFYDPPVVSVTTLRVEASFCESTQLGNTFGIADLSSTEKDLSGYWED